MSQAPDHAAPDRGAPERGAPERGALRSDLDRAVRTVGDDLTERRAAVERRRSFGRASILLAAIPAVYAFAQFGAWFKNDAPYALPWWAVAPIAFAAPFALAFLAVRRTRAAGTPRAAALGAIDEQLRLEGRLLAADEFAARGPRSAFESAALEDAVAGARRAAEARLAEPQESSGAASAAVRRRATGWALVGALMFVAAGWFNGLARDAERPAGADAVVAEAGAPLSPEPAAERENTPPGAPEDAVPEPPSRERATPRDPSVAKAAQRSPEVNDDAKESSGTTGAGRSSGALSSSAASESKSSPSSQGKGSEPSEQKAKKPADKKKPKDSEKRPDPVEKQEDEESGSTAGKGSSKGSNKNPTASDWKSRDQVTETDEQEIEDDDETDDDEEEQENRGGVQPSLRDRRPPVSRDLQIGFGNRPNPDANGRGGPSEQKKSRGVASLVLGVPIPDRIKGRPGPGPTKITQERIEPEAEEATPITASARRARTEPLEAPAALVTDAALRAVVRDYFLARRSRGAPKAP